MEKKLVISHATIVQLLNYSSSEEDESGYDNNRLERQTNRKFGILIQLHTVVNKVQLFRSLPHEM